MYNGLRNYSAKVLFIARCCPIEGHSVRRNSIVCSRFADFSFFAGYYVLDINRTADVHSNTPIFTILNAIYFFYTQHINSG